MKHQQENPTRKRVVILGGGFGGLYAAQALKSADLSITLIDRRNFHLFQPLLYQVATGGLSPGDIASPLRAVLKRGGLQVISAADGPQAIELFREHAHEITFVLLDLTMPRLDGIEALQKLRCIQTNVQVLVMSGYSEQDVSAHFAGLGAAGFIQKPFLPHDLVIKVCQLLPSPE